MVAFIFSLMALVLVALLLGVHLTGYLILNPALRRLEAALYIPVKQSVDSTAPRLAKPLMLASLALTAAAITAGALEFIPAVEFAAIAALLAPLVTLWAIVRGDLPINREMAHWSVESPPPHWRAVRTGWERFFGLRVAANTLALLALGAAVVASASRLH